MIPTLPFEPLQVQQNENPPSSFIISRIVFGLATSLYLLNIAQYASPNDWLYAGATTDIISLIFLQGTLGACMGSTARPALLRREHQLFSTAPFAALGFFLACTSSAATLAIAHTHNYVTITLAALNLFINIAVIALVSHEEKRLARTTNPRPNP